MRKLFVGVALGAALVFGGSAAAVADDVEPAPLQTSDYTPDNPTTPTLAGSTAVGDCDRDVPWISYNVELNDPDSLSTSNVAYLVMTNGSQTHEIRLGELVDNKLSGRVLWPGAAVDAQNAAAGWPGWTKNSAGEWVETDGNFRWTRGAITTSIRVNPELSVALTYPPATPDCAAGPTSGTASAGFLPATGLSAAVMPIGIAGGIVVAAGIVFLVIQRRRRSRA